MTIKKLIQALEEENIIPESDVNVTYDHCYSQDAGHDIITGINELERLTESTECLLNNIGVLKRQANSGQLVNTNTMRLSAISTESIYKKLGIEQRTILPALETYKSVNSNATALNVAIEGMMDTLKALIKRIKDFFINLWKIISDFLTNSKRQIDKHISYLETSLKKISVSKVTDPKETEFSDSFLCIVFASELKKNDVIDRATIDTYRDYHTLVTKCYKTYLNNKKKLLDSTVLELVKAINDLNTEVSKNILIKFLEANWSDVKTFIETTEYNGTRKLDKVAKIDSDTVILGPFSQAKFIISQEKKSMFSIHEYDDWMYVRAPTNVISLGVKCRVLKLDELKITIKDAINKCKIDTDFISLSKDLTKTKDDFISLLDKIWSINFDQGHNSDIAKVTSEAISIIKKSLFDDIKVYKMIIQFNEDLMDGYLSYIKRNLSCYDVS